MSGSTKRAAVRRLGEMQRGHRVGYGVEETSRHGDRLTASSDWPLLLTRQPEDVVEKGSKHLRTVGVYLTTHKPVSIPRCQQLESDDMQSDPASAEFLFCKFILYIFGLDMRYIFLFLGLSLPPCLC